MIGKSLVNVHRLLAACRVPIFRGVLLEESTGRLSALLRYFECMLENKALALHDYMYLLVALFKNFHSLGLKNSIHLRKALSETGAIDVVSRFVLSYFEGKEQNQDSSVIKKCFQILDFTLTMEHELCAEENDIALIEHYPIFCDLVRLRFFDIVTVLVLDGRGRNIDQEDPRWCCHRLVLQMLMIHVNFSNKVKVEKSVDPSLTCFQPSQTKKGKRLNVEGKKCSRKLKNVVRDRVKLAHQTGRGHRNRSSREMNRTSVLSKSKLGVWKFLCNHGLVVGICYSITHEDEKVRYFASLALKEMIGCDNDGLRETGQNRSRTHIFTRENDGNNVVKTFVELGCLIHLHGCRQSNIKSSISIFSLKVSDFVNHLFDLISSSMVVKSSTLHSRDELTRYTLSKGGKDIMATLDVNCSSDMKSRICLSLIILSLHNDHLKCILADHKHLSASITTMVASGNSNEETMKMFGAISMALPDLNAESTREISVSSTDNLAQLLEGEDSSVVTFLHCDDMQGKVRFDCPSINELRLAVPKLAIQVSFLNFDHTH